MSFIPEEEIRGKKGQLMAPMIDFLFLMLIFFASIAVSRVTTRETDVDLVAIEEGEVEDAEQADRHLVHLSIAADGSYKWITEIHDYPMGDVQAIVSELLQQHQKGLLPKKKSKTHVLLKIDKETPWEPILKVIYAVRDEGFEIFPLYESL